jgi:hypothetical protein
MKLEGVIWLRTVIDKLALKHNVDPHEVEEAFENKTQVRFVEKAKMFIWHWDRRRAEGI